MKPRRLVEDAERFDLRGMRCSPEYDSVVIQTRDGDQEIMLCTTHPHFGGERRWAWCSSCGSRARVLYMPQDKSFFACRRCHGLIYRSAYLPHLDRARQRVDRLRAKLATIPPKRVRERRRVTDALNAAWLRHQKIFRGQLETIDKRIARFVDTSRLVG